MVKWIPDNFRIVVLMDQDRQDIAALKKMLERMSSEAGLETLSAPGKGAWVVATSGKSYFFFAWLRAWENQSLFGAAFGRKSALRPTGGRGL